MLDNLKMSATDKTFRTDRRPIAAIATVLLTGQILKKKYRLDKERAFTMHTVPRFLFVRLSDILATRFVVKYRGPVTATSQS